MSRVWKTSWRSASGVLEITRVWGRDRGGVTDVEGLEDLVALREEARPQQPRQPRLPHKLSRPN